MTLAAQVSPKPSSSPTLSVVAGSGVAGGSTQPASQASPSAPGQLSSPQGQAFQEPGFLSPVALVAATVLANIILFRLTAALVLPPGALSAGAMASQPPLVSWFVLVVAAGLAIYSWSQRYPFSEFADAAALLRSGAEPDRMLRIIAIVSALGGQTYLALQGQTSSTFGFIAAALVLEGEIRRSSFAIIRRLGTFSLDSLQAVQRVVGSPAPGKGGEIVKHEEKLLPLAQVRENMVVRILAGDWIVVDGSVVAGGGQVAERYLSGLATMRVRSIGHHVFAGSRLQSGELCVQVESLPEDSRLSYLTGRLEESVAAAPASNTDSIRSWTFAGIVFCSLALGIGLNRGSGFVETGVYGTVVGLLMGLLVDLVFRSSALIPVGAVALFFRGLLVQRAPELTKVAASEAVVVDSSVQDEPPNVRVVGFDTLDERVEAEGLTSALLALLGEVQEPWARAFVQFLQPRVRRPHYFRVEDVHHYPGIGVCGLVEGAEFTVGIEQFLIERGVPLQESEVSEEPSPASETAGASSGATQQRTFFVAIGSELAARCRLEESRRFGVKAAFDELHRAGVRSLLCGKAPQKELDTLGKELSFELAQIVGGLSEDLYTAKLRELSPVLLYVHGVRALSSVTAADTVVVPFDDVRWNLTEGNVLVCSRGVGALGELLRMSSAIVRAQKIWAILCIGTAVLCGAIVLCHLISASVLLLISMGLVMGLASYAKLFVAKAAQPHQNIV